MSLFGSLGELGNMDAGQPESKRMITQGLADFIQWMQANRNLSV
jgi:hypothetical protein